MPCETIASYLRDYAKAHPDKVADTGWFEFLNNAAHLADGQTDNDAPVSAVGAKSFDALDAALASIDAKVDDVGRKFLAKNELETSDWVTEVQDLRPYTNLVVVSQTQGTLTCDKVSVFRVEDGILVPTTSVLDEMTSLCYSADLIGIRVDQSAYLAVWEGGGGDAEYHVSLLRADQKIDSEEAKLCSFVVSFATETTVTDWISDRPEAVATPLSLSELRSVLEPILVSKDPAAGLKALQPRADGNTSFDTFLQAADRSKRAALEAVDPRGQMLDGPYADVDAYLAGIKFYPIAVDGHRLILVWGEPIARYRMVDDSAIRVWEWTSKGLLESVSATLGIRGTNPTISVE